MSINNDGVNGNAYKPEPPILPPMKSEDNLHNTQIQSSVTHTLHTLHSKEKKEPRSFRIKPSDYTVISTYARIAGMAVGDVVVESCILYMDLYPVDGLLLVSNNGTVIQESDLDQLMLIMECTQELEDMLVRLRRVKGQGVKFHRNTLSDLRKVFAKCRKVKNKSPDMETMIREAMSFVGF